MSRSKARDRHYLESFKNSSKAAAAIFNTSNPYEKAIVGGEILNFQMEIILKVLLREESLERLVNVFANAPLSTFGSRIEILHGLYIIDSPHYLELKAINQIRNRFAHFIHGLDFTDDFVKGKIEELRIASETLNEAGGKFENLSPGQKFSQSIGYHWVYLTDRTAYAIRLKHVVADNDRVEEVWVEDMEQ